MWNDLGEYIANLCDYKNNNDHNNDHNNDYINGYNSSFKVVEIAIGKFFSVADYLKNYDSSIIDFIAVDIGPANSNVVFDDITNPNMNIYKDADIIYSIRPPYELQPYIGDIVANTGATLIVRPLFNEDLNLNLAMKLVNYKKAVFYQSI